MDVAHKHGQDSSALYGMPKISYPGKEQECTPFPSSLKACLGFMGQPNTYHYLMAVTGAAFRLPWNTECWGGGNVDILGIRPDVTELLRRAMGAVGRGYTLLWKEEGAASLRGLPGKDESVATGDKRAFIELIRSEIDSGRPLIGFGVIGPPDACIITGYRNGRKTLLGWNFFQDMPEYSAGVRRKHCGYFIREGWYEHPYTIAILGLGEHVNEVSGKNKLIDTLTYALDIMETSRVHERSAGFAAYDAWTQPLLQESEFPKGATLPMLMERLMCQADGVTMIGERHQAYRFLHNQAELFRKESLLAREMGNVVGNMQMGENQALSLSRRKVREELVQLIQEAKGLDIQAAGHMRQALRLLPATTGPS